jgi:uncharacterized repeat protein (TIGR03803 family)
MQLLSWLRKRMTGRAQTRRTPARKLTPRFRPQLETLEGRLTPSLTTLASFTGPNGGAPQGNLIMDPSGNLYGTASSGGASGAGTVYEVARGSGTITTLASFNGTNGAGPVAGLVMDGLGNLYGTTSEVVTPLGMLNLGTVFELVKGSGTITTLASFDGVNGANPMGSLIMDSSGNLYGTTYYGGALYPAGDSYGTVFELVKGSGTITTLASFEPDGVIGAYPVGGLVMDGSGNLWGTTFGGGLGFFSNGLGYGTIFEVLKGSHTITTQGEFAPGSGDNPAASLIMGGNGNMYGTMSAGGASGDGGVFEIPVKTSLTLASFNGANGATPEASLAIDSNGNLFGTTYGGGASGDGTVFEVAQGSGTITTLASFNGTNGANPEGGLVVDGSGNVYGTTSSGGASNAGTFFELPGTAASHPSFQISSFPSSTTAGAPQTFTLTVLNPDGTIDTGYTGTVHFASSDPQAVLPADYTFKAANAGVHTFTATLKTAGPQSITATDTANLGTISTQAEITVNPAAASHLVITGPSTATPGVAFSITVTAYDAYGNVATGYTGTVHFTSSDKTASLPANYAFTASDNGVHTFAGLVLNRKGKQSITATDTLSSAIAGSLSVEVF